MRMPERCSSGRCSRGSWSARRQSASAGAAPAPRLQSPPAPAPSPECLRRWPPRPAAASRRLRPERLRPRPRSPTARAPLCAKCEERISQSRHHHSRLRSAQRWLARRAIAPDVEAFLLEEGLELGEQPRELVAIPGRALRAEVKRSVEEPPAEPPGSGRLPARVRCRDAGLPALPGSPLRPSAGALRAVAVARGRCAVRSLSSLLTLDIRRRRRRCA